MTTYKITPLSNCRFCYGTGEVAEHHPYGSTWATEYLTCDCVLEQLPEDFEDGKDDFEIERPLSDNEFLSWDDDPGYF